VEEIFMAFLNIPEELKEHIREEAERFDYQLVDISTKGRDTFFMEVVLDKEGGITLDECGEFNRRITSWIEEQNLFKGSYTLDVCSPGLDRELKSEGDFSWALGKEVKVTMHKAIGGKSVIIGELLEVDNKTDIVIKEAGGSKIHVDMDNVAKAKLHVEI
jgi:ribosome maturation factor RimP